MDKIKRLTKLVLVRELNMIDERKDARKYASMRLPTMSDLYGDDNQSIVKSVAGSNYSRSHGSPSPHKGHQPSDASVDGIQKGGGAIKSSLKPQPFSPDFNSTKKTAASFNLTAI